MNRPLPHSLRLRHKRCVDGARATAVPECSQESVQALADQTKTKDTAKSSPADSERRRFKRVTVAVPGKLFVPATGYEAACALINLSPAGTEITGELDHLPNGPIVLYAEGFGRFEGQIIWHDGAKYGIKFHSTTLKQARTADQLARLNEGQPAADSTRRHRREATRSLSRFTRENGSVVPCTVLDISTSGVSLGTNVRPQTGEFVLIGGMVGRVARHHETGIGIEFVAGGASDMNVKQLQELLGEWVVGGDQPEDPPKTSPDTE